VLTSSPHFHCRSRALLTIGRQRTWRVGRGRVLVRGVRRDRGAHRAEIAIAIVDRRFNQDLNVPDQQRRERCSRRLDGLCRGHRCRCVVCFASCSCERIAMPARMRWVATSLSNHVKGCWRRDIIAQHKRKPISLSRPFISPFLHPSYTGSTSAGDVVTLTVCPPSSLHLAQAPPVQVMSSHSQSAGGMSTFLVVACQRPRQTHRPNHRDLASSCQ
jgi:hypothetical protein